MIKIESDNGDGIIHIKGNEFDLVFELAHVFCEFYERYPDVFMSALELLIKTREISEHD